MNVGPPFSKLSLEIEDNVELGTPKSEFDNEDWLFELNGQVECSTTK